MNSSNYKHSKIAIIIATILSPVPFTSPAFSEPVDDIEISTTGVREYGVLASGEEKKLGNRASISTSGEYAYGIFSRSSGIAIIGDNATISTTGKNASALYVINSGQITLGNNATITAIESLSYGLFANGNGTKVVLGNNANFSVSGGSGAGAIWSTDSAQITLGNDAIISTSRNNAHAASTFLSGVLNIGERATITVNGLNAHAVNASGESNGTNGGIINLGANSHIIVNNNQSSQWAGSHGVRAYDGGVVNLLGGNTITMTGDNIYQTSNAMYATTGGFINGSAGGRYIIQGDIVAGGGHYSTFETGKIILNLTDESLWNGSSYTQENDEGIGTISLAMTNSVWNMSNSSTLTDLTLNQGAVINFQHSGSDYQTLTINDNYIGHGGTLVFNTVLHNDTSETDKLIVNGQASGLSYVMVNNVGGSGAETIDGIEIISTQGSTDDAFVKSGRIVAGAYEYDLAKSGNNWYLTSSILPEPVEPTPEPEPKPEEPAPEPKPEEPGNNDNSTNETKIIRPESGAYIANLSAANTMFVSRLHNRLGETQYTDYLTGKTKVTSMWLRQEGGHNRSKTKSTQSKTQTNRYVVQIGGDVAQWSTDGLNRLHLGVMAGYGYAHGNTDAKYTAYRAKNKVDGYAVGLYGTWYANQADKSGLYVDSWVQYA
ncbi:autotransporter outer membrane beta-barrel domain-containing protein [Budviciaceae bacterium BWR-B9]|uniref:Autotransporter outer membrane beta-barrel domain-containing protein n=1 Tax=Limnobaculum allomyrinae TaxID=2791986 RepID=A0ABS1IL50_9GAMM|nr:autotransporter outer membrane beta-barrel domain-containing protein [Limnobaculum allomyrinae]MBV7690645.1 autotransporter outer membrane beta-barrel domain-containing protein [Limnobaculum sp. M2-1]